MEAKDTVMEGSRKDSILEASGTTLDLINNLCEAQAEISFKAGIKEVVEKMALACVNDNTEWQKLTNLVDVMKYYEAQLKGG